MEINWDEVKTVYMTTTLSVPKVADKFGLRHKTVAERCRKDGWVAARTAFRAQVATRVVGEAVETEAARLAEIINATNAIAKAIERIVTDPDQFQRHVVTDTIIEEDGSKAIVACEKLFQAANTKAVRDMSAAVKDILYAQRNIYHLPTQAEAEAQRIAAERLKLEQRKADAAEKADQVDKSIVVRLEGDLEAYAK